MVYSIHCGDCTEITDTLPENVYDAVICDPPYHLKSNRLGSKGFMGQEWDGGDISFKKETWEKILRVAKPGAHLLAFGGTRSFHRIACAIEDAGWELRDCIMWLYGTGWPKSVHIKEPGWDGFGTALKPAYEPIIMARKPLAGTISNNLEKHHTGVLNIDECRLGVRDRTNYGLSKSKRSKKNTYGEPTESADFDASKGRFPANVIHDGSDDVMDEFEKLGEKGGGDKRGNSSGKRPSGFFDIGSENGTAEPSARVYNDSGTAARFFYCAKATTSERGDANCHPTVKPLALMRYLVKLVGCQTGSTILDPFCGSGTTGIAVVTENHNFVGIELSEIYAETARKRIKESLSK